MNIKVNLTKKLVETLTREIIAENKAKRVLKEATLKPETEKTVQGIVNAVKKHEGEPTEINENLISDDAAQLIMQIILGAYGTAAAAMVGNLIYTGIKGGKEELKDAFKQIAADLREKHGGGIGGTKKGGGIAENKAKRMHEEVETLDPEVQKLVDKIKIEIEKKKGTGKIEKTEMNEGLEQIAEVVSLIMLGFYGVAAVSYFGSLLALAFKKGGKEEFQKAVKQLQDAHKGSDGVPRFNK
jgi:undecaprenyl pyrophosphate synthase